MEAPEALVASITALALIVAEGRDSEELDLLGAVFAQLGDTLSTMAIQRGRLEDKQTEK